MMDSLQVLIRCLPVELRQRIYRELVKIQVKRKELLHPLRHRCFNHWYLRAIRGFIQMKAFQRSDLVELEKNHKILAFPSPTIYVVSLLDRVPEEELESYQNLSHNVNLVQDATSERIVSCALVTELFGFDTGVRSALCRKYTYYLLPKKKKKEKKTKTKKEKRV